MLSTRADFPAAGSDAFLAPTGEAVRIQRRNDDGTLLVSKTDSLAGTASGNTNVPRSKVFANQMDAIGAGARGRNRRTART